MKFHSLLFGVLAWAAVAGAAIADPCEAPVRGYSPGSTLEGVVRYVGDGDNLCIGNATDPAGWIEVRLANWFAPELDDPGGYAARDQLRRLVLGRRAICVVERGYSGRTYDNDRVFARCSVAGRDVADILNAAGVRQGGRGWRGGS